MIFCCPSHPGLPQGSVPHAPTFPTARAPTPCPRRKHVVPRVKDWNKQCHWCDECGISAQRPKGSEGQKCQVCRCCFKVSAFPQPQHVHFKMVGASPTDHSEAYVHVSPPPPSPFACSTQPHARAPPTLSRTVLFGAEQTPISVSVLNRLQSPPLSCLLWDVEEDSVSPTLHGGAHTEEAYSHPTFELVICRRDGATTTKKYSHTPPPLCVETAMPPAPKGTLMFLAPQSIWHQV